MFKNIKKLMAIGHGPNYGITYVQVVSASGTKKAVNQARANLSLCDNKTHCVD
jgi:hypothetical protein